LDHAPALFGIIEKVVICAEYLLLDKKVFFFLDALHWHVVLLQRETKILSYKFDNGICVALFCSLIISSFTEISLIFFALILHYFDLLQRVF